MHSLRKKNWSAITTAVGAVGLVIATSMVLLASSASGPSVASAAPDRDRGAAGPEEHHRPAPDLRAPELAPATRPAADTLAADTLPVEMATDTSDLRLVTARLRTALEASLFEEIDPGAILDAALELGRLQVDQRPLSEPYLPNCTVYPMLDAPDGTSATLWVAHSSRPEVERVLAMRIELDPAMPPYVLADCARANAIAHLQMQLDHQGRALNLSILTDFPPSPLNFELGYPLDGPPISQGLLYALDVGDHFTELVSWHGLSAGRPDSRPDDRALITGAAPSPEKVDAFRDLLQSQYESLLH